MRERLRLGSFGFQLASFGFSAFSHAPLSLPSKRVDRAQRRSFYPYNLTGARWEEGRGPIIKNLEFRVVRLVNGPYSGPYGLFSSGAVWLALHAWIGPSLALLVRTGVANSTANRAVAGGSRSAR